MSVPEHLLRTYPSPNPTTANEWQLKVFVGLGGGHVRSC